MQLNRRHFLKGAIVASLATSGCQSLGSGKTSNGAPMMGFAAPVLKKVRVGNIGIGGRGNAAVSRLMRIPGAEVVGLADFHEERVTKQLAKFKDKTPPKHLYHGSEDAWKRLCEAPDIDLIYITSPWEWHAPMAVYAMKCGKHAVCEVPAALSIKECWDLVKTSEQTRRHCMMLENCCYGFNEMLALNMCRQKVFGTLVHGEGAYIHERLKSLIDPKKYDSDSWRRAWTLQHNGNPYPTHGLGPIAKCMDINCGDSMARLTSMSSNQFGLTEYATEKFGPESKEAKMVYKKGDMNITSIRTELGRTIMLQHDTTSPRPYSRLNTISGTKGILADYPLRIALGPNTHDWLKPEEQAKIVEKYTHPLWSKSGKAALAAGGHGGMDYLMDFRLVHCLINGLPLDMSVYDAAAWSCIVALSEQSVRNNSNAVNIPDFTRGAWKTTKPCDFADI
ncbi:MAG: Gfo/Idh/MocA family oxidoreductase [Kiritimatiellia bacterium]